MVYKWVVFGKDGKFMEPTWGPPGSCRSQMGPMFAPWTLLSGRLILSHWMLWPWWLHIIIMSKVCVLDYWGMNLAVFGMAALNTGIRTWAGTGMIFSCDQAALRTPLSVCLPICLSVTPFSLCFCHRIITKFSGVIANDRSDVHAKRQGYKSKVKVTEVITQLSSVRTVAPVSVHIWWWNDA